MRGVEDRTQRCLRFCELAEFDLSIGDGVETCGVQRDVGRSANACMRLAISID